MCGIAGASFEPGVDGATVVTSMLDMLKHRGPDDHGVWSSSPAGVFLGQRRLAVLDLSEAGKQPMHSASGRFTLVYNGEIYNYLDLRSQLEKHHGGPIPWRGHSDTEALLAGFEAWGIESTLKKANGMFALAVWDVAERRLSLARDRMGEKPLYFGWIGGRIAFASELKAMIGVPGWNPRMCDQQIRGFLYSGYVRGHLSAIEGIYRLPPGTILSIGEMQLSTPMSWEQLSAYILTFWSLEAAARHGIENPFQGDFSRASELVERLLIDAVSVRTIADVPLGAFLSGGVDSSLIVALMQRISNHPIRTYSIGFSEQGFDEAPFAREVARHLGTDHTEFYVGAQEAGAVIPELQQIFDEPFADQSAIPTLLCARLARRDVTVSLSGDGGDELFAGYGRYGAILPLWRRLSMLPPGGRRLLSSAIGFGARAAASIDGLAPGKQISFRANRLAQRIAASSLDELRQNFISGANSWELNEGSGSGVAITRVPRFIMDPLRNLLYGDQIDYLPDNILVKLDRTSMAVSLESRVPFLDHRLVELSWSLPNSFLHRNVSGKTILRDILFRHVPRALIERPKQGFSPPIDLWLRGPLREWAADLLSTSSLKNLPMVNTAVVSRLWRDHQSSRIEAGYALWNVLMLAGWRNRMSALD